MASEVEQQNLHDTDNLWNRFLDRLPQENLERDVLVAGCCGLFLAGVALVTAVA